MTQEYKDNLLDYIVGEFETTQPGENDFRDMPINQNNLINVLSQNGIPTPTMIKVLSSNNTSNYLMYGIYQKNNVGYGFIVVCSQNGDILKVLTAYDSGTKFGVFDWLEYDENGNIYGWDYFNSRYRVILLNNVAVAGKNGYTCKLRSSYYVPSEIGPTLMTLRGTSFIKKVPGEATYFIFGTSPNDASGSSRNIRLARFKINVGTANEWDYFDGETTESTIALSDFLISKDGDNTILDICYSLYSSGSTIRKIRFNGSSLSSLTTYDTTITVSDLRMETANTYYVSSRTNNRDGSYNCSLYKITNMNSKQELFNYMVEDIVNPDHTISIVNGIVFTKFHGANSASTNIKDICNVYVNNNLIKKEINTTPSNYPTSAPCQVQRQFNLYKFIVQTVSEVYKPTIVIYDDYSGTPYVDYDYFISKSGELYSNNSIVFARTLYDKQTYANTTNSIISVPNNYLNDITINSSKLLSETMSVLVNDTTQWTKNVYENLFINFANTIQVVDEDTNTLYPSSATYVNTNIQSGLQTNYNNQIITKIRINYEDGTNKISPIVWHDTTEGKQTQFGIYVDKNIQSIDFISDDETFVYITKQYTFEVGKTYVVSQKLRIE